MGVFTKCALKLYPWPGPFPIEVEGTIPAYRAKSLPKNLRAYTIAFPNWQAYADTLYKVYDSEIGYIIHRQFNKLGADLGPGFFQMFTNPSKTIDDLEDILKKPEIKKLTEEMRISTQVILAGMTVRDIAYQEKALDEILAETKAWKVTAMSEPEMENFTLLYLIKMCFKALNMTFSGGYRGSWSQKGTPDFAISYVPVASEILARHQQNGLLVQAGGDSMMGPASGQGGGSYTGFEQFCFYDPADINSVKASLAYFEECATTAKKMGLSAGYEWRIFEALLTEQEKRARFLKAPQPALYNYQRKIREVFNPNNLGDDMYTVMPNPEE
jgi:hypothetical protein